MCTFLHACCREVCLFSLVYNIPLNDWMIVYFLKAEKREEVVTQVSPLEIQRMKAKMLKSLFSLVTKSSWAFSVTLRRKLSCTHTMVLLGSCGQNEPYRQRRDLKLGKKSVIVGCAGERKTLCMKLVVKSQGPGTDCLCVNLPLKLGSY